ncbi:MAG: glycosyltransferase family 2 protein [Deltaproteobacteria bacterium]|nr:glycosyltransferase family 2 protein [Deltaproteobacteria bacterium]
MLEGKRIGIVVPAFNEERWIRRVLETMPSFVDRVFVVDDCSSDRTVAEVLACQEKDSKIVLLQHDHNRGVGKAIASGYQSARDDGFDVVAVMAGDAQMDPEDLEAVVRPVVRGEVDYAKGNRLFRGESWRIIPHTRYLGNAVLSLLTKIASGYWHVGDFQCGYTAISRSALQTFPLEEIYPRYGMPNDLLIKLNMYGLRVRDVSVRPVYPQGGKSGIKLTRVIPQISLLLIKGFFRRLFYKYVIIDFHPLVFFYLLGLATFPAGFAVGAYLFFYRLFVGPVATTSALFAVFLIVSGLQSLFFAMWFDKEYNHDLR